MYRRYAIYITPDGPLGHHGAAWLGWDIAKGCAVAHPEVAGLDIAKITKRPRKYGLHATIKPPMVLASGTSGEELERAACALARRLPPVQLDGLEVRRMGRFLALTPRGDAQALNDIAAEMVANLDIFRAPVTAQDLARRRQRPLTASQDRNLTTWGYPYVMEDFQFHITLTGPLQDAETTLPHVAEHFAPVLPAPYVIDHLTLAGEDSDGMFHTIVRLPLGGSS